MIRYHFEVRWCGNPPQLKPLVDKARGDHASGIHQAENRTPKGTTRAGRPKKWEENHRCKKYVSMDLESPERKNCETQDSLSVPNDIISVLLVLPLYLSTAVTQYLVCKMSASEHN